MVRLKYVVSIPLLFLFYGSKADDPSLAISLIPDELKENSYAVIRKDIMTFEIHDESNATLEHKKTISILDPRYKDLSRIYLFYRPELTIKGISGEKYDAEGKEIDKLKNRDIEDYSAYTGSFYDENRIKVFDLLNAFYPYTYEYEYTREYKGLHSFPEWNPLNQFHIALQYGLFRIIAPAGYEINYLVKNMDIQPEIKEMEGKKIYTWELSGLHSFEEEDFMPDLEKYSPQILTAPTEFNYEGYPGNLKSWKSYGEWIYELNQGRDQLPPETIEKLKEKISGVSDRKEIIQILYDHLQSNTRYVSIQLGIGGFQPFEASFVDEYGYGDCKALTNYMKSILSVAGIDSYYSLVNAGRDTRTIYPEFPSAQFNHVILCVPHEKDTIWLECTSQNQPFGYLGSFTCDRPALIISENGGVLRYTPDYKIMDNIQKRISRVFLNGDGKASANVHTTYSGLQYENIQKNIFANHEDQRKILYKSLDISDFEILEFNYKQNEGPVPKAEETLRLEINRFANSSGKRIFFQPNLMNKQYNVRKQEEKREYEVELKYSYWDIDSIYYTIPDGMYMEYMPDSIELSSKFGSYSRYIIPNESGIIYVRKRMNFKGIYPPEDYQDYVNFINKIAEEDALRLVLVNKT